MLTRKEKDLIKRQKIETLAFISIKSSVVFLIKSAIASFCITFFMAYMQSGASLPIIIMCVIASFLVYLMLAKYEFGSWLLCFKLTIIYFRIKISKLRLFFSRG